MTYTFDEKGKHPREHKYVASFSQVSGFACTNSACLQDFLPKSEDCTEDNRYCKSQFDHWIMQIKVAILPIQCTWRYAISSYSVISGGCMIRKEICLVIWLHALSCILGLNAAFPRSKLYAMARSVQKASYRCTLNRLETTYEWKCSPAKTLLIYISMQYPLIEGMSYEKSDRYEERAPASQSQQVRLDRGSFKHYSIVGGRRNSGSDTPLLFSTSLL